MNVISEVSIIFNIRLLNTLIFAILLLFSQKAVLFFFILKHVNIKFSYHYKFIYQLLTLL